MKTIESLKEGFAGIELQIEENKVSQNEVVTRGKAAGIIPSSEMDPLKSLGAASETGAGSSDQGNRFP